MVHLILQDNICVKETQDGMIILEIHCDGAGREYVVYRYFVK